MRVKPGTKVLITEDCREGGRATGQIGIYEGDFPYSVIVAHGGEYRECEYESFMQWNQEQERPFPSIEDVDFQDDPRPQRPAEDVDESTTKEWMVAWDAWWDHNRARMVYYSVLENPRIRLEDGSVIWGAECWWGTADDAPPLAEAQARTEKLKTAISSVMKAIIEDASPAFVVAEGHSFRGLNGEWELPTGTKSARIYEEDGQTWVEFEGGVSLLLADVLSMDGIIALGSDENG